MRAPSTSDWSTTRTGPLPSPLEVGRRLMDLGVMFDEADAEREVRDEECVKAKQAYEVAFSRALLSSNLSSEGKRKAEATLAVADLKLHAEIAAQVLRGVQERIKTLEKQMEIARSVGATSRAEMSANGWTP